MSNIVAVSVSSSGDSTVYTNPYSAARIIVNGYTLQAAAGTSVSFYWKDSLGNVYMEPIIVGQSPNVEGEQNPGTIPDPQPQGGFSLPPGANLIINLSATATVTGSVDLDLV